MRNCSNQTLKAEKIEFNKQMPQSTPKRPSGIFSGSKISLIDSCLLTQISRKVSSFNFQSFKSPDSHTKKRCGATLKIHLAIDTNFSGDEDPTNSLYFAWNVFEAERIPICTISGRKYKQQGQKTLH